jgi:hypothetical protein
MKRLGKVFLGMLCIILLFAFSHASAEKICAPNVSPVDIKTNKIVTFEWTAPTKYMNNDTISKDDGTIMYEVYSYQLNGSGDSPKTDVKNCKYEGETDNTYLKIIFQQAGEYVLGVRAYLFKNGIEVPERKSDVSWSCSITCTNNNPQYVNVSE